MVTVSGSWNPVIIGDGQLTDGDVEVMPGGQLRYSCPSSTGGIQRKSIQNMVDINGPD